MPRRFNIDQRDINFSTELFFHGFFKRTNVRFLANTILYVYEEKALYILFASY